jgi:gas vesicle protein
MDDDFENGSDSGSDPVSGDDDGGMTMAAQDSGLADFIMAFSLGALFGAGLALFLAPQSGEKTRKELGKKSKKWKKQAGKKIDSASETLKETGGEWLEDAEEIVEDWSSEIAEAVEDGINTIRSAVEDEIGKVEKKLGKKKKGLFR